MIATSPTPPETTPLSLAVDTRFHWGVFICMCVLSYQILDNVPRMILNPAFRLKVLNSPWELGAVVLGNLMVIGTLIYNGYLAIPASRITLVEDGLEVQTHRGTWVIPYRAVRRIKKETHPLSFRVGFENHRFLRNISSDGVEAFMAELSARSGVEIKS